jgi:diadenosine tetraphosphatase ApaH/serine/threonine PP2A family protein phosphatase
MRGRETDTVPERFREPLRWVARTLHPEYDEQVGNWPGTFQVRIPGIGETLFCHATPRKDTDVFFRQTEGPKLQSVFEALNMSLVVCGHTHMQFDRTINGIQVVNSGSVGQAYGGSGAYWLLLGPNVQHKHTSYNLETAAARIRESEYPLAEDFAKTILQPFSEEEIRKNFGADELK